MFEALLFSMGLAGKREIPVQASHLIDFWEKCSDQVQERHHAAHDSCIFLTATSVRLGIKSQNLFICIQANKTHQTTLSDLNLIVVTG